jgi:hypothetical protein
MVFNAGFGDGVATMASTNEATESGCMFASTPAENYAQ